MNEAQALAAVIRTFPGTRRIPPMTMSPDASLTACSGLDCGHMAILVDSSGAPWHRRCKLRSVGIAP